MIIFFVLFLFAMIGVTLEKHFGPDVAIISVTVLMLTAAGAGMYYGAP